jgi:small subunit ribosomal protein S17
MSKRGIRRKQVGVVASDRMAKTIVVDVERLFEHPKYGKRMRRTARYYAHDEERQAKAGDKVEIVETRPLSKMKRWRLVRVIEKA